MYNQGIFQKNRDGSFFLEKTDLFRRKRDQIHLEPPICCLNLDFFVYYVGYDNRTHLFELKKRKFCPRKCQKCSFTPYYQVGESTQLWIRGTLTLNLNTIIMSGHLRHNDASRDQNDLRPAPKQLLYIRNSISKITKNNRLYCYI